MIARHGDADRFGDGVRMLDRAEGVLVALRRCTIGDAFAEIVAASQRHNVPALQVAQALVELAQGKEPRDANAAAVAHAEWADLLSEVTRS